MLTNKFPGTMQKLHNWKNHFVINKVTTFAGYLLLSWVYAICSQIIIPLPFNLVPLSIQPAPLFLASFLFGWHAVNAYILYLAQGACGLPFFSGLQGGLIRLLGPTGGYLVGFGIAMALIAVLRKRAWQTTIRTLALLLTAEITVFIFGLFQLAWFLPAQKLLIAGLFPFLVGDFFIKIIMVFCPIRAFRRRFHF
jgi:biotin transport system substrate-specific component